MSRMLCVAVGLAVTITACSGCSSTSQRDDASGPAPTKLRAVVLPFLTASPFYIATEEGFFEEQNLEVEFVRMARNVEAIPALATGEVDVGFGQLTVTVLNAIASGATIKLVAGTGYLAPEGCSVNGVVARRALVESGRLAEPEQLRGLKVELDTLLPIAFFVDRLLQPAGLSIDDLDIVNLPMPAQVDALIAGSIDVTVVTDPYITRMVKSGQAVLWRPSEQIVPDFQMSSVMFGPNLLEEQPEIGERFMVAFRKGMQQYELGKTPRNLEILSRGTGLSVDQLQDMCWPTFREDGRVGTEGLMDFQAWLVSRELIDHVLPEEEFVEGRFVDYANTVVNP